MSSRRALVITLSGRDRPGVSSVLFETLSHFPIEILDIEQTTIHSRLTLATLVTAPSIESEVQLRDSINRLSQELNLECTIASAEGDVATRPESIHVTVIGAPLRPSAMAKVAQTISECNANIDRITRMATEPVTAIEFDVSGSDVQQLRSQLTQAALDHGVDIAVQRGGLARRAKRLIVMDVDSTLIENEVIDLLAAEAGVEDQVRQITERAMAGEMDFATALRARVALLKGLPETALRQVQEKVRLTPGARTLIKTLQQLDHNIAVVSGGFIEVVQDVVADLGISLVRANSLETSDGHLTGEVRGAIVDREGKAQALREFATQTNTPLEQTVAIGDGANDIDMIATAGLGIAFNAKQVVRDHADTALSAPYLDSVLYLLGIPSEFAVRG